MILLRKYAKLVSNEFIKNIFNKSTIVMLVLVVLSIMMVGIVDYNSNVNKDNWKTEEQRELSGIKESFAKNLQEIEKAENEGKSDTSEIKVLYITNNSYEKRIDLLSYSIDQDIPLNVQTPWRFVRSVSSTLNIVILLIIIFSIKTIVKEYSYGTIKQILIHPFSRSEILFSKQLTAIILTMGAYILHFLISLLTGYILFSSNGSGNIELINGNDSVIQLDVINYIYKYYLFSFIKTIILIIFAITLSIFIKKSIIPLIVTAILWLGSGIITNYTEKYSIAKYTIFPHINLTQYLSGNNLELEGNTFTFSIIILFIYLLILALISYWRFSTEDVY